MKLHYATGGVPPEESAEVMFGDTFKKYVEEKTNGKLKVNIYSSGSLGTDTDVLKSISVGSVEMGLFEIAMYSNYCPKSMVFTLPGQYKSIDEVNDIFNSEWAQENIFADLEKSDLKMLGGVCKGFRNLTSSKKELRTPKDIVGQTIRVQDSKMYIKMVEALSANPVVIPGSEMYTAMQNKVVDGHENTIMSYYQDKTYEVQKYAVMNGHIPSTQAWVINKKFFESLPKEYQDVILEAVKVGNEASKKVVENLNVTLPKKLQELGLSFYYPTEAELEEWRNAIAGPCLEFAKEVLGEETINMFLDYLNEYRESKS